GGEVGNERAVHPARQPQDPAGKAAPPDQLIAQELHQPPARKLRLDGQWIRRRDAGIQLSALPSYRPSVLPSFRLSVFPSFLPSFHPPPAPVLPPLKQMRHPRLQVGEQRHVAARPGNFVELEMAGTSASSKTGPRTSTLP